MKKVNIVVSILFLLLVVVVFASTVLTSCSNEISVCTVYFDSRGGSDVGNMVVMKGSRIVKPSAPTKEGYVFGGWYKDSDYSAEWVFNYDTVNSNLRANFKIAYQHNKYASFSA